LSGNRHEGALGAVYEAATAEEVARLYDGWASTYDAEMAVAGYRHPSICLALLARHVPAGSAPVLDAGAGTGLVGEWLGIIGYPRGRSAGYFQGHAGHCSAQAGLHPAAPGSAGCAACLCRPAFCRHRVSRRVHHRACRARGAWMSWCASASQAAASSSPSRQHCGTQASRQGSASLSRQARSRWPSKPNHTSRCPEKPEPFQALPWC
jgi:hypothetical protein